MLTLEITVDDKTHYARYFYLEGPTLDQELLHLLDNGFATCRLWCGNLLLTGKPIETTEGLREAIVQHSRTILRAKNDSLEAT